MKNENVTIPAAPAPTFYLPQDNREDPPREETPEPTHEAEREAERQAAEIVDKEIGERDERDQVTAREYLKEKWGADYQEEIASIRRAMASLPKDLNDALLDARTRDGTALCNTPRGLEVLRRLAQIEKYRQEHRSAYNRDESLQREERGLIRGLMKAVGIGEA